MAQHDRQFQMFCFEYHMMSMSQTAARVAWTLLYDFMMRSAQLNSGPLSLPLKYHALLEFAIRDLNDYEASS